MVLKNDHMIETGGHMNSQKYQTLKDLAAPVAEHLVPEIEKAVEVCIKSFLDDEFNDKWIFGTHLWKNTWNRFETLTDFEDCPFEVYGKGNEYKLKIGPFVVRHHRIDRGTRIPKGARAAKTAASAVQLALFKGEWGVAFEKDNIVIAIDADIEDGLREVFIGELMPLSFDSKKYSWVERVPVYLAEGAEPSSEEIIQVTDMPGFSQFAPEEEIPEVTIGLDKSKVSPKAVESEGDR